VNYERGNKKEYKVSGKTGRSSFQRVRVIGDQGRAIHGHHWRRQDDDAFLLDSILPLLGDVFHQVVFVVLIIDEILKVIIA
jgi:hypothetical protein